MAHHAVNTVTFNTHVATWIAGGGNNAAGFSMAPSFVGVLDIGQGAANAVFNASGQVILYYDMGGGSGPSRFTFPENGHAQLGPRYCNHARPRFLLSHWDWDHWRGAIPSIGTKAPQQIALGANPLSSAITANTTWAAKSQGMGPLHNAIRNKIYNLTDFYERTTVGGGAAVTVGHITLILCDNNQNSPDVDNQTGFALRLEDPGNAGQYILLSGDAHFPNIPAHGCDQNLVGLVASHHGAEETQNTIPRPIGGAGPVVHSFGAGNKYGHPRDDGVTPYTNRGYVDAQAMQTSGRDGASPHFGPRGNVALKFASTPVGPGIAAGGGGDQLSDAAIAVLASATTAAHVASHGGNLTSPQLGHIAAAAAYEAVRLSAQPQAAFVATRLAAAAAGLPPQTHLQARAPNLGGAPCAELADTLAAANAAATSVQTAACQAWLAPVGALLAEAHSQVAIDVTTEVNTVATWPAIGTRSKRATQRAYAITGDATTINALAATLGGAGTSANVVGAFAAAPPTQGDVGTAAAEAAFRAARAALGYSAVNGESPPVVAQTVYNHVAALGLANVTPLATAMLAAAAAMMPHIPVQPEAPIAAPLTGGQQNTLRDSARAAVAAAYAGVTLVGNHQGEVARVAVAAARAAMGAAAGLPQPGCHRHPRQCGAGMCSLTLHYGV
ncbi:hypothetical protein JY651_01805 [Pyxidicoccus parkwayensis]|uniref:Uncharacterized protein n=1 Tax=Pyxidicoccus parkwayensis TaxID=2813578 RepID=A0ABX7NXV5_9BACT|nr:hypothetical protein [Pyxidicoccus parkwaysis]QSQ23747.1 hypothetical protein JY651_01805 [Pyxidicoccus parkwaysis]